MPFKSMIALKYKNTSGKKISRKANAIFNDLDAETAAKWLDKGFIREAEIGEIAEAVAAGEVSADALEASTGSKKKSAGKKADDLV